MKTFLCLINWSSQLTAFLNNTQNNSSCVWWAARLCCLVLQDLCCSNDLCWLSAFTFDSPCQSEKMGICYGVLLFSIAIFMKGWKCWMYDFFFLTLQEWPFLSRFIVSAHLGVSAFPRSVEQRVWHLMFYFNLVSLIGCLAWTLLQWDMPSSCQA